MSSGAVHWDVEETIVAIATGVAPVARGIVRLTGPRTVAIVRSVFLPDHGRNLDLPPGARRHSGQVQIRAGEESTTWPANLWLWPQEKTYTGQPSAEFHLLGAPAILQKLVQACCRAGARMAGPGEFTMRAFLAGRLDLMQAEAVLGIIHAQDPEQLQNGLSQLAGGVSHPLQSIRESLVHLLAHLEAGLDFAEEDIEFISAEELTSQLEAILLQVQNLWTQIQQRDEVNRLPEVVLLGSPNAGKSSLFNTLTNSQQAIVSDTRGTTRDFLRETVRLGNCRFQLIDTAGLERWLVQAAQTAEQSTSLEQEIEQLSESAAIDRIARADVAILCRAPDDNSSPDQWTPLLAGKPWLLLKTKSELAEAPEATESRDMLHVSSHTGAGIHELHDWLCQQVADIQQQLQETSGSMGTRAANDLQQLMDCVGQAIVNVQMGGGEELVSAELRGAVDILGRLVGTIYTDDLLDSIFSRFCIGK